jgi:hypothetical protein
VIDIATIPVTYELMEGIVVVAARPCPMDMYIWGDD